MPFHEAPRFLSNYMFIFVSLYGLGTKGQKNMSGMASQKYDEIVIHEDDPAHVLRHPTKPVNQIEWDDIKYITQRLMDVRQNILKGGAGLAAPQIGSSLPVFIYTPDRTTEGLKVVINPSFEPIGEEMIEGEEACFSVPLKSSKIKRWAKIKVQYLNLDGKTVNDVLEGFAAKVFQHEIDHLNGKLTIDHEKAEIISFETPEAFQAHMQQVHQEDSKSY
ncbi:MAG: peptide deformylase [Proteobacteria bacterium]|nr:peptide deformylase [Pseudomonadota bacterium]